MYQIQNQSSPRFPVSPCVQKPQAFDAFMENTGPALFLNKLFLVMRH